jgi:hypothetical protein
VGGGVTVAVNVVVGVDAVGVGVDVPVAVRVGVGAGVLEVALWQTVFPESVNVLPASGINCQSILVECKVSLITPYVVAFRTRLFAAIVVMEVWSAPPVPTMNSVMPLTVSTAPVGVWGAKRSYIWS